MWHPEKARPFEKVAAAPGELRFPRVSVLPGVIVATASLLLVSFLFEIVLRLAPAHVRGYEVENRTFVHPREFEVDRNRNSLGFHDVEHVPGSGPHQTVFLLGDSYVESVSVPLDQTVGRRLETYLNEQSDDPYEVVSLGHSGWGQERELQVLQQLAPLYHPDMVVTLFLTLNDVLDNSPELLERQKQITSRLLRHRPRWLFCRFEDAPLLWCERSELNRFVSLHLGLLVSRYHARSSGDAGIPVAYSVYRQTYDATWKAAWTRTEQLIAETQRYASEIGATYVVVSASTPQGVRGCEHGLRELMYSYPSMKESSWDLDKPDRMLSEICRRHEIPSLLLEPLFREDVAAGGRLHWKYDGHWNVEGNDRAGAAIATFLLHHHG